MLGIVDAQSKATGSGAIPGGCMAANGAPATVMRQSR